jgi:hypothetical protein
MGSKRTFVASPPSKTDRKVWIAFAVVFAIAVLREILILL